jgi:hypothetical protein
MMGPSAVRLFAPRERQDKGDGFCQSFTDTLLRVGVPAILRLFTSLRLFKIEHSQECTDVPLPVTAEIDGRLAGHGDAISPS